MTTSARGVDGAGGGSGRAGDVLGEPAVAAALFSGPGEVRALARTLDWGATLLGWPDTWPPALRIATRAMLDAPHPICLWVGPEYALVYNDAYRRILAAKHPTALGQPGSVVWGEIWQALAPQLAQVAAGGPPIYGEDARFVIARLGGGATEDAWFNYSLSALRDEDGTIIAVLNISPETTARVRAEQALAAERERLRTVILQTPGPLALMEGPEHRFALVNDAYKRVSGGGRDVTGLTPPEAFPELAGSGIYELFDRVYETGEPWDGPETLVRYDRDGTGVQDTWFNLRFEPLRDGDGRVSALFNFAVDVTEQVLARREVERLLEAEYAARAAAEAAEAKLRDVFEQAPVAVAVLTGPDHVYSIVSPRYTETPGGGRPLLGRSVRDAFPELVGTGYVETMDHVYATGDPFAAAERRVVLTGPDGVAAEHYFNVGYQPLRDREGGIYAVASVAYDVTAQVRARQELEAARAEAERQRAAADAANQAKSEFLSTMSHELRTPLNAIGGYAELLALGIRGPVTDAQGHDLDRLRRANQHMAGLVDAVLNFARLDAGQVEYHHEAVPLGPVVADLEALVGPQLASKQLAYDHDGCGADSPDHPHVVCADPEKVRQILLNVLTNAAKFTDAGGRVALACETDRAAGVIRIRVTDTGRGIAADQLERVFEPFVQLDRHRTQASQQGVGLGLAISRDLARGMGGDLTVESTPGVGSTFTLTLPVA